MKLIVAIAVMLPTALAAAGSAAQSAGDLSRGDAKRAVKMQRYVSRGWNIAEGLPTSEPMRLAPGAIALRQSLQPSRIVATEADVADPKSGKIVLPRGSYLFVAESKDGSTVACDLASQSEKKMKFDVRWCLKDTNRDGRFEELAFYVGVKGAIPVVVGYWPKSPKILSERVGYIDQATIPDAGNGYSLALRYSGITLFNRVTFDLVFGRGDRTDVIGTVNVDKGKVPGPLSYAGAEIDLISLAGEELVARVLKPIAPGPLDVFPSDSTFGGTG